MKVAEARKLIGKPVKWGKYTDRLTGEIRYDRRGVIEAVERGNVQISGEWGWLNKLTDLCERKQEVAS